MEIVGRARIAIVALAVVQVVHLVAVVVDVVALQWLDDVTDSDALDRFDTVTLLSAGAQYLALVVAAIVFVRWFNAAHRNLDALCPGVRRHETWWSITSWIIPIMGLFRPKQIHNDMLACALGERKRHWWASWWWILFLVGSFVANVAARRFSDANTLELARSSTIVHATSGCILIAGAFLAIIVVRRTTDAMETKRREVARQPQPQPPEPEALLPTP